MTELILLPWTIFKYIFSLGLWGALFMTLHFYWQKHDCTEWTVSKFTKKTKQDKPEDYIV
jgi:hypothetical protein